MKIYCNRIVSTDGSLTSASRRAHIISIKLNEESQFRGEYFLPNVKEFTSVCAVTSGIVSHSKQLYLVANTSEPVQS